MREEDFKKVMLAVLVVALIGLSFIIIRPILIAVLTGLILSYIFHPLYNRLHRHIRSPNFSASIVVFGILFLFLIPIIFLIPKVTNQVFDVYLNLQNMDFADVIQQSFPAFFNSFSNSADFLTLTGSVTTNIATWVLSGMQKLVFNIPSILLQIVVALFTFFFMLRDYDITTQYFLSISPFSKEAQNKFYEKFEQVTNSILYGQLIVGITQGIIAGLGYFIFGVPNALLLTILTMLVGVIPVIGPWLVWMPIDIYLFLSGNTTAAIGLLIYGFLIVNWIDSLIRPLIVSRITKMNSAIALIGMVGGLYVFGIIGLILGPLILAYLLLVVEFYKERKIKSILIEEDQPVEKPHILPHLTRRRR